MASNNSRPARPQRHFWRELRPEDEDRTGLHWRSRPLAVLYAAVYAGSFYLLLRPLDIWSARWPPIAAAAAHALLPPLFGTAVCAVSWFFFRRERRMMIAAFRQLALFAVLSFAALQFVEWGDGEAQRLILHFYSAFVLFPLLLGTGTALFLYYRHWKEAGSRKP